MEWIDGALPCSAALTLAALLCGCTAMSPRKSPLPSEGATMTDIYRHHMALEGANSPRERLPLRGADDDADLEQRRDLSHAVDNRFERLPNPDLRMHVFPHLSLGRYPVPGYDTVFPMYETVHYALPGEVPPRRRPANVAGFGSSAAPPSPGAAARDARGRASLAATPR